MNGTTETATHSEEATQAVPLPLPHLERDLRLIQRYAFLHSNAPFRSDVPLIGRLIVRAKSVARAVLRRTLGGVLGTQDQFNAAVAEILFEFTRRAATPTPLALGDSSLQAALEQWAGGAAPAEARALNALAREVTLLREQVRAAQLTASENERAIAELRRELDAVKRNR